MSELCCKSCGSTSMREESGSWGPHTDRVVCADCGRWVKWGKNGPSWKQRAVAVLKRCLDAADKANDDALFDDIDDLLADAGQ